MNNFIDNGIKKKDFKKWEQHYKICDACAFVWKDRKFVEYIALQKSEGGRFDFINLGLCELHYKELPDE